MLNRYIIDDGTPQNKKPYTVYRAVDDEVFKGSDAKVRNQKGFRIPHYLATTTDKNFAQGKVRVSPLGQMPSLLEIDIPANCLHAAKIEQISAYKNEKEVLILPFSVFWIKDISYQTINNLKVKVIKMGLVQNNKQHEEWKAFV